MEIKGLLYFEKGAFMRKFLAAFLVYLNER